MQHVTNWVPNRILSQHLGIHLPQPRWLQPRSTQSRTYLVKHILLHASAVLLLELINCTLHVTLLQLILDMHHQYFTVALLP